MNEPTNELLVDNKQESCYPILRELHRKYFEDVEANPSNYTDVTIPVLRGFRKEGNEWKDVIEYVTGKVKKDEPTPLTSKINRPNKFAKAMKKVEAVAELLVHVDEEAADAILDLVYGDLDKWKSLAKTLAEAK